MDAPLGPPLLSKSDQMIAVTGTIRSIPYRVGIHPAPIEGELYGCVMGSTHATALLFVHVGDLVQLTPTHSAVELSLDDPASVLAALCMFTNVIDVEGVLPGVNGDDSRPHRIY